MNGSNDVVQALRVVCQQVQAHQAYLSQLDAALGDGDHGISMAKTFGLVNTRLDGLEGKDIGTIFREVGITLLTAVGGAMGPIFGTAFLEAGKAAGAATEITPALLARMLNAAEEGVRARGKAQPGDKTMLDALHPAAEAAAKAAREGYDFRGTLAAAADAAKAGAESTRGMDLGVHDTTPVDYPEVAQDVAERVASGEFERGILVCGTGIGVAITANKVPGIRAAQAHDTYSAERAIKSNNAQILTMGSRVIGPELAKSIVDAWLQAVWDETSPSARKVAKIMAVEEQKRSAAHGTRTSKG